MLNIANETKLVQGVDGVIHAGAKITHITAEPGIPHTRLEFWVPTCDPSAAISDVTPRRKNVTCLKCLFGKTEEESKTTRRRGKRAAVSTARSRAKPTTKAKPAKRR